MISYVVKRLQLQDLKEIARIHLAAFPKSALSRLGEEAVRRYYQWQLEHQPGVVALGAYSESRLVAFCVAGVFRGALSGFLRNNRGFLARRVLTHPWLIANPLFRERLKLARTILIYRPLPVGYTPSATPKSLGILSIAVDPQMQGVGYGKRLMLDVEKIARIQGFERMQLTVAVDNDQAIAFYQRGGWQKASGSDGTWHGFMIKSLVSAVNE